ncbi:hypothetical protein FB451DRAFT_1361435 [Mycena latifolia]|nr:hypothetical protein FB451DRAFT_1361435 [Mycena latifolia]
MLDRMCVKIQFDGSRRSLGHGERYGVLKIGRRACGTCERPIRVREGERYAGTLAQGVRRPESEVWKKRISCNGDLQTALNDMGAESAVNGGDAAEVVGERKRKTINHRFVWSKQSRNFARVCGVSNGLAKFSTLFLALFSAKRRQEIPSPGAGQSYRWGMQVMKDGWKDFASRMNFILEACDIGRYRLPRYGSSESSAGIVLASAGVTGSGQEQMPSTHQIRQRKSGLCGFPDGCLSLMAVDPAYYTNMGNWTSPAALGIGSRISAFAVGVSFSGPWVGRRGIIGISGGVNYRKDIKAGVKIGYTAGGWGVDREIYLQVMSPDRETDRICVGMGGGKKRGVLFDQCLSGELQTLSKAVEDHIERQRSRDSRPYAGVLKKGVSQRHQLN